MKRSLPALFLFAAFLLSGFVADAQTSTKKSTTKSKSTKTKTTTKAPKAAPAAITVKLKSKCEKEVMVFAGPKNSLRDPRFKQREVGGLSVNTFYLKTGDVVCILDNKKQPLSCVNVTKATQNLEINFSGTAIAAP